LRFSESFLQNATSASLCAEFRLAQLVAAREGGYPRRHLNVLAFIQTAAALVLFPIDPRSYFFHSFFRSGQVAGNKITG
jgi:hypothetical protein